MRVVSNYNPRDYDYRQMAWRAPKRLGCYSLDSGNEFLPPSTNLKIFRRPPPGTFDFDLNVGFDSWIAQQHSADPFTKFNYIMKNAQNFLDKSGKRLDADFVVNRGLLTGICKSPYDNYYRNGWDVLATQFKGTVYIVDNNREVDVTYNNRNTYFGKNFERFVLTDASSRDPPNPLNTPLETSPFYLVLSAELKDFKLLYSAEVDGCEAKESGNSLEEMSFVELKTIPIGHTRQRSKLLEYRFPSWWCQSFLAGIDTIYCGLRTNDGHVRRIEKTPVRDLPQMARDYFCPNAMLNCGANFFKLVKETMAGVDCHQTVYNFRYNPKENANVTYEIDPSKSFCPFLPLDYVDFMNNL